MTSIVRDKSGRYVPLVRPKKWNEASIRRSRERTERIAETKKRHKAWQTTSEWLNSLDPRGIIALEEDGIPWTAVQRWLDESPPTEVFSARMLLGQVLEALGDDQAPPGQRVELLRELYRRLIARRILD